MVIESIISYVFGEYEFCGIWCGFFIDLDIYKYKFLLKGLDLKGEVLWEDFIVIFLLFVKNVEKLVLCGSILLNEFFNNIVVSKVLKVRYYSGLESFDFCVKVVIC